MRTATEDMKHFATAIATANGHPDPKAWAGLVVATYEAESAAEPVAEPTADPAAEAQPVEPTAAPTNVPAQ